MNKTLESSVQERTKELEEALKTRDDFLSLASHELKTPITALKIYIDKIALKDKTYFIEHPDKIISLIHRIKEQSNCLENLINKLFDITMVLNNHSVSVELQHFNLSDLIQVVIERYTEKFNLAECELIIDIAPLIFGFWDPVRIEQLLVNLMTNAIKFAPGSPIIISLTQDSEHAILEMRDHGNGIEKAKQKEIFERYVQLPTQQSLGGLGLGLWIVKQTVLAHQGDIILESDQGKGCYFRIRLPTMKKR